MCVMSGLQCSVNDVFTLLGWCTALISSYVLGQHIGPIFKGQAVHFFLDCLMLVDGIDRLSWNIGNYQSTLCGIPERAKTLGSNL
jgi:hypothetical protein